MLSGSELEIVKSVIYGMQNVSTYGYAVVVKGTVVSGAVSLLCALLPIIVTIYLANQLYKWAVIENSKTYDKGVPYVIAAIVTVMIFVILYAIVAVVIYDPCMNMLAPEYVVVNKITEAALNAAT